jgi:hypothetical protein
LRRTFGSRGSGHREGGARSKEGLEMGKQARRRIGKIVAAVAVSEIAYKLFIRASVRRAFGIEA